MAILTGSTSGGKAIQFELTPIRPTLDGPRDAYRAALTVDGASVFDAPFSVFGRDAGHFYVFRMARAFQNAPHLVDMIAPFNLDEGAAQGELLGRPPLSVRETVGWLEIVLWGKRYGRARIPNVFVQVYLSPAPDKDAPDESLALRQFARLNCVPEDVEAFGHELERQCITAREERARLGIPAIEELWPADDEAEAEA